MKVRQLLVFDQVLILKIIRIAVLRGDLLIFQIIRIVLLLGGLLRVVVLNRLPSIVRRLPWLGVCKVPLAVGLGVVGNSSEIGGILLCQLVHRVHVVAVDRVVRVLNLMLDNYSPLRLPLLQPRVSVELLQLLFVDRAVLLREVLGVRLDDLACLFVDQGISAALFAHDHLALLQVVHILVDMTLSHDCLAMEHRSSSAHLIRPSSLHGLLIVARGEARFPPSGSFCRQLLGILDIVLNLFLWVHVLEIL